MPPPPPSPPPPPVADRLLAEMLAHISDAYDDSVYTNTRFIDELKADIRDGRIYYDANGRINADRATMNQPLRRSRRLLDVASAPPVASVSELMEAVTGSPCSSAADCSGMPQSGSSICSTFWKTPVPCLSCPDRSVASDGFRCLRGACACSTELEPALPGTLSAPSQPAEPIEPAALQANTWLGTTWCDRIVRDYASNRNHTVLEQLHAERCVRLRVASARILSAFRMYTVAPDILYNPHRAVALVDAIYRGLTALENVTTDVDERIVWYRLAEARVDPVFVIPVWRLIGNNTIAHEAFRAISTFVTHLGQVSVDISTVNITSVGARVMSAANATMATIAAGSKRSPPPPFPSPPPHVAIVTAGVRRRRALLAQVLTSCSSVNVVGNELISLGNNIAYAYSAYFGKYTMCLFEAELHSSQCSRPFPRRNASKPGDGWGAVFPIVLGVPPPLPVASNETISFGIDAASAAPAAAAKARSATRLFQSVLGTFGLEVTQLVGSATDGLAWLVDRAVKILEALFTCDYAGSAMCSYRPDDAPEQISAMAISWVGSAYMFVFFARVWGLGLPLTLAIPAVYVFVSCRILMTVYQLKFGCLVKLVFPVCVWDDLYAAVTDTLGAPHIAWPEGLLPRQVCINSEECVQVGAPPPKEA